MEKQKLPKKMARKQTIREYMLNIKKGKELPPINNIEELLKSRRKNPVATLKLIKDMARRIKELERKFK